MGVRVSVRLTSSLTMYQGGVLAQGGWCRQLDTSAASLARPLVELVPPTGEEQTVELQVHQRN